MSRLPPHRKGRAYNPFAVDVAHFAWIYEVDGAKESAKQEDDLEELERLEDLPAEPPVEYIEFCEQFIRDVEVANDRTNIWEIFEHADALNNAHKYPAWYPETAEVGFAQFLYYSSAGHGRGLWEIDEDGEIDVPDTFEHNPGPPIY